MGDRYSTAKVDIGLLTPNFPLFMNKQSQRYFSLRARTQHSSHHSRILLRHQNTASAPTPVARPHERCTRLGHIWE